MALMSTTFAIGQQLMANKRIIRSDCAERAMDVLFGFRGDILRRYLIEKSQAEINRQSLLLSHMQGLIVHYFKKDAEEFFKVHFHILLEHFPMV